MSVYGPDITFQQWGDRLADFSQFRQLPGDQAEASLRRGLLEEVLEVNYGTKELGRIAAMAGDVTAELTEAERLEREKELADTWYYIRQITSYRGVPDHEVVGDSITIAEFQDTADKDILPIRNTVGDSLKFAPDRESKNRLLAVTALRVVDVMNPKVPGLWIGVQGGRPTLGRTLMDLAKVTAFICRDEGLNLSRGMINVHNKLIARKRSPAVIGEALADTITSGRARFNTAPWVGQLILLGAAAHWDPSVSRPYDVIS